MNWEIRLSLKASKEAQEIATYYKDISIDLGNKFNNALLSKLESIKIFPNKHIKLRRNIRVAYIPNFPYTIAFRLHEETNTIIILSIWHQKRNPKSIKL